MALKFCVAPPIVNRYKIYWRGKLTNNCNCNKYYCRGSVAGILGILLMNSETVDICRGDSNCYLWSVLLDYKYTNLYTVDWKWRTDRRSKRNLCNCVKKPEKNSGPQWGLNPRPHDTGAMLYQLSYETNDVGSSYL